MFITASGLICPVGLNAEAACAAKRAGISALEDLSYVDNSREAIVGGVVPLAERSTSREELMTGMLVAALREAMSKRSRLPWERVPLLIGLAEPDRPGGCPGLATGVFREAERQLDCRFSHERSAVVQTGHTAAFRALKHARDLLTHGIVPACLVCCVDSYIDARSLAWLDRCYRLKTPANRDGAAPGEGAAAVVLEQFADDASTEVVGLGFGLEQAPILSEEPLLGRGLASAVQTALAQAALGLHEIDVRLSDVTGELFGFKELALMEGRLLRVVRKEAQPVWHWSESIGDSGAAAGAVQLVCAEQAFRRGYMPGDRALCLTSSVAGDRAAAVLRNAASSRD